MAPNDSAAAVESETGEGERDLFLILMNIYHLVFGNPDKREIYLETRAFLIWGGICDSEGGWRRRRSSPWSCQLQLAGRRFIPKDGAPRRNGVSFISPTGEEIKNRKHLSRFLRSHPGGPSLEEFDWGYGDTPRRSVRIRQKVKATESPEEDPPMKRQRKVNSSKRKQKRTGKDTGEEVDEVPQSEKPDTEAVESIADALMKDVEDGEDASVKGKAEATDENNATELVAEGKSIEEEKVNAVDADQDSAEIQVGEDKNEPAKVGVEVATKNLPVLPLPETTNVENPVARENHEKLEVEEAIKDMPVLSPPEATKEEDPFAREKQEKLEVEEASKDTTVLSVPEATRQDNSAVKDIRVVSTQPTLATEPSKEDLLKEEVKNRTLFNSNHSYEQKI